MVGRNYCLKGVKHETSFGGGIVWHSFVTMTATILEANPEDLEIVEGVI
jgi:hypothetical protein